MPLAKIIHQLSLRSNIVKNLFLLLFLFWPTWGIGQITTLNKVDRIVDSLQIKIQQDSLFLNKEKINLNSPTCYSILEYSSEKKVSRFIHLDVFIGNLTDSYSPNFWHTWNNWDDDWYLDTIGKKYRVFRYVLWGCLPFRVYNLTGIGIYTPDNKDTNLYINTRPVSITFRYSINEHAIFVFNRKKGGVFDSKYITLFTYFSRCKKQAKINDYYTSYIFEYKMINKRNNNLKIEVEICPKIGILSYTLYEKRKIPFCGFRKVDKFHIEKINGIPFNSFIETDRCITNFCDIDQPVVK